MASELERPIRLATPRGFCAGVDRAIAIVNRALEIFGAPIFVRHEVVHNRFVVDKLRQRGAIFVDEIDQIPDGATVIFSAHGVAQAVVDEAARRRLQVFDATCPLVTKVHLEVVRHAQKGESVVMVGHAGHPEVEGTLGRYPAQAQGQIALVEQVSDVAHLPFHPTEPLFFVTQTTLSMDDTREIIAALQQHYPHIRGQSRDDICYATQNRQDAVKQLAQQCDLILVVGSANSSNSNRLREVAERQGCTSYLIDSASEIRPEWFIHATAIGVTAGASAPENLVDEVVVTLKAAGYTYTVEPHRANEEVYFPLPKALR